MITDNNAHEVALIIYKALGDYLRNREQTDESFSQLKESPESLSYLFTITGKDLPMIFQMYVREKSNTLLLRSLIPFDLNKDKLAATAVAVCWASNDLIDGCFDLDLNEGSIYFKMVSSYDNDKFDPGVFAYMTRLAPIIIDEYNDTFYLLNEGKISVTELLEKQ